MKTKAVYAVFVAGVLVIMGGIIFNKLHWEQKWIPEKYVETDKFLANSERGFYNMRGVTISDIAPVTKENLESIANEEHSETLELLQINIGEYQNREISASGTEQIRDVLDSYKKKNKKVRLILRPLYDWDGKGSERDPSSVSLVMRHMEQLGEIFADYEEEIYIIQGVLVGSWAEMHSSRYLTEDNYLRLIDKMHECMPKSVFLAVRTPAFWRIAAKRKNPLEESEAWQKYNLISRLSLFNDGMLGNSLDCGTYGDITEQESVSLKDKWKRDDELEFQKKLNLYVPNGGEAVLDNELNDLENADYFFGIMHVSYLNNAHDDNVIEKWENTVVQCKNSVYSGMSGFEYIERHLGYRYVIRDVSVQKRGWIWEKRCISIEIENVGYAPRYTPCEVELILVNTENGHIENIIVDSDVRQWRPGENSIVSVDIGEKADGIYEVWLSVKDQYEQPVFFANDNRIKKDGSCFLGTIKKGE